MAAQETQGLWLKGARTYLVAIGLGNLAWEAAQFPLYIIWYEGSRGHQLLARVHGTVEPSRATTIAARLMEHH